MSSEFAGEGWRRLAKAGGPVPKLREIENIAIVQVYGDDCAQAGNNNSLEVNSCLETNQSSAIVYHLQREAILHLPSFLRGIHHRFPQPDRSSCLGAVVITCVERLPYPFFKYFTHAIFTRLSSIRQKRSPFTGADRKKSGSRSLILAPLELIILPGVENRTIPICYVLEAYEQFFKSRFYFENYLL